ncbi:MAG: hypothetical protein E7676_01425 [Ruminococcaceae bacterium]|nr:hypothetical protein [Oscillospiraceae bacterium]
MNEELIKILNYRLKGELPNPFIFDDGTPLRSAADWERRRAEIYKSTIELQYGTMPPKPDFLRVELLYTSCSYPNSYRIVTGTKESPISFIMYVFRADSKKKAPAVIDGDMCFSYLYDEAFIKAFTDNGIDLVCFNRCELATDVAAYSLDEIMSGTGEAEIARAALDEILENGCGGQVKRAYPDYSFGTLGAWAWGYSRCVDALEILGFTDMDTIAFTGHSRGGKTAALAGALDERASIVNPNGSCSGGYGSYRISIDAETEDGEIKTSEPLSNILHHFPAWLGEGMREYVDREELLPFDSHYLKALVAPRALLVTEGASDIMANPVGSHQTTEAAGEVYKFLGCEDKLFWQIRSGKHTHGGEDVRALVSVIRHIKYGEPLYEGLFKLPFKPIEKAYKWTSPERVGDEQIHICQNAKN